MQEIKILIFEEDDMINGHVKGSIGGDRILRTHNHVVLRKKDGSTEIIKDRWDHPGNKSVATIALPQPIYSWGGGPDPKTIFGDDNV